MKETLQYFFDKEADILYVSQGLPRADAESEEVGTASSRGLTPGVMRSSDSPSSTS